MVWRTILVKHRGHGGIEFLGRKSFGARCPKIHRGRPYGVEKNENFQIADYFSHVQKKSQLLFFCFRKTLVSKEYEDIAAVIYIVWIQRQRSCWDANPLPTLSFGQGTIRSLFAISVQISSVILQEIKKPVPMWLITWVFSIYCAN